MIIEPNLDVDRVTETVSVGKLDMTLDINSSPENARKALLAMTHCLTAVGYPRDATDSVELVLAEVINNIVEHAHSECSQGLIEITLRTGQQSLECCIKDNGKEMPNGQLPSGLQPEIPEELADLPEGGFGWYLIKSLACDVSYTRSGNLSHLTFRIPMEASA
jgi:serine/threonine-protein kinase RsbW